MGPNEVVIFGLTAIALLLAGIVFARAPRVSNLPTLWGWIFAIAASILLLAGTASALIAGMLYAGL